MSGILVKLNDGEHDFYLEWCNINHTPLTRGMPLGEFEEWYKTKYGDARDLKKRLKRVEKTGCSSFIVSLDDILEVNHAGDKGEYLKTDEIIKKYCLG